MLELSDDMELIVRDKDGNEHKITLADLKRYIGGWLPEHFD